ncbi:hypothetical protein IT568_10095 [bacterium]|nr:hypothetical protein [bacterium]
MKIFSISLLVFIILSQNAFCGSLISQNGIGEIVYSANVRSAGMGGTGISFYDSYTLNTFNPASWTSVNNVRFSAEFLGQTNKVSGSSSGSIKTGTFNGITFGVPIKNKVFLGLALVPYSDYGFNAKNSGTKTLTTSDTTTTYDFQETIKETGGLSQILLGAAVKFSHFSVGAKADFLFGKLREERTVVYDSINGLGGLDNYSKETEGKMQGVAFTFGIVASPVKNLTLGATYTLPKTIDYEVESFYDYDSYYNEDTKPVHIDSLKMKLPISFSGGIAYKFYSRYLVSVEYFQQNFKSFEIVGGTQHNYKNSSRVKFGTEFDLKEKGKNQFWRMFKYRAGFNFATLYQTDKKNNSINEYLISFGLGFPFAYRSYGASQIDLAFEFGQRGSETKNGISETIYKMTLGITGLETWFVKQRRR